MLYLLVKKSSNTGYRLVVHISYSTFSICFNCTNQSLRVELHASITGYRGFTGYIQVVHTSSSAVWKLGIYMDRAKRFSANACSIPRNCYAKRLPWQATAVLQGIDLSCTVKQRGIYVYGRCQAIAAHSISWNFSDQKASLTTDSCLTGYRLVVHIDSTTWNTFDSYQAIFCYRPLKQRWRLQLGRRSAARQQQKCTGGNAVAAMQSQHPFCCSIAIFRRLTCMALKLNDICTKNFEFWQRITEKKLFNGSI